MPIPFSSDLYVSKNYRWDEDRCEFWHIGNKLRRSDRLYEARVDVYEDRVKTWFLEPAATLLGREDYAGDYVALSMAVAYIEGVEQYRRGDETPRGDSTAWFKASAKRIFSKADDDALKMLWESVRVGLFHSGFTTDRVYLNRDQAEALTLTADRVLRINARLFMQSVMKDFEDYISNLRSYPVGTLAQNFESLWEQWWENS